MTSSAAGSSSSKAKLVIAFDADDTLWHNEIYYQRAGAKLKTLLEDYLTPEGIEQALATTESRNISFYGYGIKSFTLSMVETAISVSGGGISAGAILSVLELGREMLGADVLLFEHATAALTRLAGSHELMLITKGDLLEQGSKIRRSGIAHLFRYTEIVQEKTPQTYRLLLERYGIAAGSFVMVGNSLKSDVLPVLEIGGRAVFVPSEHTWAHEHADGQGHTYFEIEHLGLLPDLISSL